MKTKKKASSLRITLSNTNFIVSIIITIITTTTSSSMVTSSHHHITTPLSPSSLSSSMVSSPHHHHQWSHHHITTSPHHTTAGCVGTVLLRLYGCGTETFFEREKELVIFKEFAAKGLVGNDVLILHSIFLSFSFSFFDIKLNFFYHLIALILKCTLWNNKLKKKKESYLKCNYNSYHSHKTNEHYFW